MSLFGEIGFSTPGGRGSIKPPKICGGRVREKGSIDRIINQGLWTPAPKKILSIENGLFFSPNIWQMMIFLHPLDALIPKIPF